ncbi:MAG: TIGR02597 family protein [Akkermansiaceae bacterium]
MKSNKIKSTFRAVAACSALGALSLANIVSAEVSAPVGFVKLTFNAESDTPFSLPMNRPKVYGGQVVSISGNEITISDEDFTASELVYDDTEVAGEPVQPEKYYVLFTTGTLEGRTFDVTANGTDTVTVDQDGDTDIEDLIDDAGATDNFEIRPHWTLGTAFPNGEGIPKTTTFSVIKGIVQFREVTVGTNIPITKEYTYFDSSTDDTLDGWYLPNSPESGKKDNIVLSSKTFYVFRNNDTADYTPNIIGDVPLVDFSNSLDNHLIENDSYKAIAFPVALTLTQSRLVESGAFKPTTSFSLRDGDTLQAYTYPITIFNQPISTEYVYFDSSDDSLDGWYLPNSPENGKKDDVTVFQPGRGYIIRTVGRDTVPDPTSFWLSERYYDPFYEAPTQ